MQTGQLRVHARCSSVMCGIPCDSSRMGPINSDSPNVMDMSVVMNATKDWDVLTRAKGCSRRRIPSMLSLLLLIVIVDGRGR